MVPRSCDTRFRPRPSRHWRWADLMRRAFDIDGLACPQCGDPMRLLATIEDPRVVEQVLARGLNRTVGPLNAMIGGPT